MKRSTRVKFTMTFIGLMVAVLVSMWAMNGFFLEGFYAKQKLRLLENACEDLSAIAVDKEFRGQNITEELQSPFSSDEKQTGVSRLSRLMNDEYNTTIVIQGSITEELIPLARDGKFLTDVLRRYILEIIGPGTETLISQDSHQVQKIYNRRSQSYYLQSWGFFDDNRTIFIMSMPLASIHDSVNISNGFLAYVGLTALVLGSAFMYRATKKVVSPVRSLTALPARISELDFEARYTSDLEDEIGVLDHNMNTLPEKLKETIGKLKTTNNELQGDIKEKIKIDETHKEFIANVSHELKTPTALIQGYAEGLTESMVEDKDSHNYYCEVIMDEAGKVNKMVKQLLTLTALKFGNDMPVTGRFDIAALTHGVLSSAGILLQQKEAGVVFSQEEPIWMWAGESRIEEVITDYPNNTMNHLEGKRRIEIRLERKEEEVRVTVFNTGRHIPEEDLGNLWIKSYKADKARTREYGDSGIGLSIVKAITDSHNKSCGIENANGGIEFWFIVDSGIQDGYKYGILQLFSII